jgi:hypothetical protein
MKNNRQCTSLKLSDSRWLAYAAAGAASAFVTAPPIEAEIHYSGLVNIRMEGFRSVFLPLTNGVSLNFTIFYSHFFYPAAYFRITGAEQASALTADSGSVVNILARVEEGHAILGKFGSVAGMPGIGGIQTQIAFRGYFDYPRSGLIGFKFKIGNGTRYGWARIVGRRYSFQQYHYEIKDYAWADNGERIVAGQTSSTEVSSVSEFGSLGLLAVGAEGLELWRGIRSQTAH